MSLLNQVLKDLDARRADAGPHLRGRSDIRPLPAASRRSGVGWLLATVGLAAAVAAGGYWWWRPAGGGEAATSAPVLVAATEPAAAPVAPRRAVPTVVPSASPSSTELLSVLPPPVAPPVVAAPPMATPASLAPPRPARPSSAATEPALHLAPVLAVPAAPAKVRDLPAAGEPVAGPSTIDKRPREASAHERADRFYRAASLAATQGRAAEALQSAQSALGEDAGHLAARQLVVRLLLDARDWASLRGVLEEGLDRFPVQIDWALLLARLRVDQGDTEGALAGLERVERQGGDRADFQGGMAAVLHKLGRFHDAELHYQRAATLDPANGRWWLGLALACEAQGKPREARESYVRAAQTGALSADLQAFVEQKVR